MYFNCISLTLLAYLSAMDATYLSTMENFPEYDMQGTVSANAKTFEQQLDNMLALADVMKEELLLALVGIHKMKAKDSLKKPTRVETINNVLRRMKFPMSMQKYIDEFTSYDIEPTYRMRDTIRTIINKFREMRDMSIYDTHTYIYSIANAGTLVSTIVDLTTPSNSDSMSLLERLQDKHYLQCDFEMYEGVAKSIFDAVLKGEMLHDINRRIMKNSKKLSLRPRIIELKKKLMMYPTECTSRFRHHAEQSILYLVKPRGYGPFQIPNKTIEQVSQDIYQMLNTQFAWLEWTVIVYKPDDHHAHGYRGSHNKRRQPIHFFDLASFYDYPIMNIVVSWYRKGSFERRFLATADVHCVKYFGPSGQRNHAEMTSYDAIHYAECAHQQYDESQWNLVHVYRCRCSVASCTSCEYLQVRGKFAVQGCDLSTAQQWINPGCKIFRKEQTIMLSQHRRIDYIDYVTIVLN